MPTVAFLPEANGELGPDFTSRYTRTCRVEFETGEPFGPLTARLASGMFIGQMYATGHETDEFAFCNRITMRTELPDVRNVFLVTGDYGPWEPCSADPLLNPPEIEVDYVGFERVVDRDVDTEKAIVNSAGDPFDPPVTADDSRLVITITRNEEFYDESLAELVRDKVNDAEWRGKPAGTVKASAPKASRQFHPSLGYYWKVTYVFHVNSDGWQRKILDAGFRRKATSGTGQVVILSKDNAPVSTPVPLDGLGQPLDPADDPVFLPFTVYGKIGFGIFNMDDV